MSWPSDFRGTGLAQEAARALQVYAFTTLDMLCLLAMPDVKNERSARFLARLGYEERAAENEPEGTYRFFELYRDDEARGLMRGRFDGAGEG